MAGEDAMVERLLLSDKYRYLNDPEDYPGESEIPGWDLYQRESVDQDEFQQLLETASLDRHAEFLPYTPQYEANQIEYELGVAKRLRELELRFPGANRLQLLEMAL
jgi:hypothetical protein